MGQLFQKVNSQLVEVPLAEKNDNVPILMVSDVNTVASDQLANVWIYELGDNIYSLNFDIPVGPSAAIIEDISVEMLPADSAPTVKQEPGTDPADPSSVKLVFGLPAGTAPASLSVGSTTTLPSGQEATVTITGDATDLTKFVLDFGIPKGADSYSAEYYDKAKPAAGSEEEAALLAAMPDGGLITFEE